MSSNKLVTVLDAVTATTTSAAIDVQYAEKITLLLTRANNAGGTSTFSVSGSIDGTTYVTLNSLIEDVTNTNAQNYVRTASVAIANADGNKIVAVDLENNSFKFIKVTVTETSDGTHSCKALIEY